MVVDRCRLFRGGCAMRGRDGTLPKNTLPSSPKGEFRIWVFQGCAQYRPYASGGRT